MNTVSELNFELENYFIGEVVTTYDRKKKKTGLFVSTSSDAERVMRRFFKKEEIEHREKMFAIFLSRRNEILGWQLQSIGGTAGTVCDPKVLFQSAILCNAAAIILAHNHPSGNPKPSQADIDLTKKVKEFGKLIE